MAKPEEWFWIVIHRSRGTLQWHMAETFPELCDGIAEKDAKELLWGLVAPDCWAEQTVKHKNTCLLLSQCCVCLRALKYLDSYQVLMRIIGSHEPCDIPLFQFIVVQNCLWLGSSASVLASLDLTGVPWLNCVRTVTYTDLLSSGRIPDCACTAHWWAVYTELEDRT